MNYATCFQHLWVNAMKTAIVLMLCVGIPLLVLMTGCAYIEGHLISPLLPR